jgi:chemotaxis family two-component system sensor kinase Cph1
VVGHSVAAAAQMAITKSTLRVLTLTVVDRLEEIVPLVARAERAQEMVATAFVAVVDGAADRLSWLSLGHLPGLVRHPDGRVHRLHGTTLPPIGLVSESGPAPEMPFPHGTTLVLYTDGLVERRDTSLEDGIARLEDLVAAAPPTASAAELLEHLATGLLPDERPDDVAIIVARHVRPTAPGEP